MKLPSLSSLVAIVSQGNKAFPQFKYINALLSVAALLAIVFFIFRLPPLTAIVGSIVTIVLALFLVLFTAAARSGGPNNIFGWIILGFMLVVFIASVSVLWYWFFFGHPSRLGTFFGEKPDPAIVSASIAVTIPISEELRDNKETLKIFQFDGTLEKPDIVFRESKPPVFLVRFTDPTAETATFVAGYRDTGKGQYKKFLYQLSRTGLSPDYPKPYESPEQ